MKVEEVEEDVETLQAAALAGGCQVILSCCYR